MSMPPPAKRARTGPGKTDTLCDCCVRMEAKIDELIEDAEADDLDGVADYEAEDWMALIRKLQRTAKGCLKRKRAAHKPKPGPVSLAAAETSL